MKAEILSLIGKEHPVRVLLALRKQGPLRFSEIQRFTGLNPAQLDRSLKLLRKDLWVVPETLASAEGPIHVRYLIGKRGGALLNAMDAFRKALNRQRSSVGEEAVRELEAIYP